jgi:hypothetical protein
MSPAMTPNVKTRTNVPTKLDGVLPAGGGRDHLRGYRGGFWRSFYASDDVHTSRFASQHAHVVGASAHLRSPGAVKHPVVDVDASVWRRHVHRRRRDFCASGAALHQLRRRRQHINVGSPPSAPDAAMTPPVPWCRVRPRVWPKEAGSPRVVLTRPSGGNGLVGMQVVQGGLKSDLQWSQ